MNAVLLDIEAWKNLIKTLWGFFLEYPVFCIIMILLVPIFFRTLNKELDPKDRGF